MSTRTYRVTLRSDALFTASSGTVGRPESLDSLPGATLLGAAAARLYGKLPDSFAAFQLGGARFGEGRPVHPAHGLAVPVPRSWHASKGGSTHEVRDLSAGERPAGQFNQAREGWVVRDANGTWRRWRLGRRSSLRTAIQEDGRARDGFLFGFEAVPAGTVYRVAVTASDEVHAALTGASVRVGRSRSAEFGDAKVEVWSAADADALATKAPLAGRVRFLCASDLALVDHETGAPRLVPVAADFGFADATRWELDFTRSFLRFRRYSPFHGHRRRPDMERQVIEAGSVLCFAHSSGASADLAALRAHAAAGVGEHRGAGLGEVLVEPTVLAASASEMLQLLDVDAHAPAPAAPPPADPLVGWLTARSDERARLDRAWDEVETFIRAERLVSWPITRSQWGRVRALAGQHRRRGGASSAADVLGDFQRYTENGVAAAGWGRRAKIVGDWALARGDDAALCLEILGRRVPRHLAHAALKEDADG